MIRIQHPAGRDGDRLLAGSDLTEARAARAELDRWAQENGYRIPGDARQFAFFNQGTLVREWFVLERAPKKERSPLLRFLLGDIAAAADSGADRTHTDRAHTDRASTDRASTDRSNRHSIA